MNSLVLSSDAVEVLFGLHKKNVSNVSAAYGWFIDEKFTIFTDASTEK